MAYRRHSLYVFADGNSTGVDKLPNNGMILKLDTNNLYRVYNLVGIVPTTTVDQAILSGNLVEVSSGGGGGGGGCCPHRLESYSDGLQTIYVIPNNLLTSDNLYVYIEGVMVNPNNYVITTDGVNTTVTFSIPPANGSWVNLVYYTGSSTPIDVIDTNLVNYGSDFFGDGSTYQYQINDDFTEAEIYINGIHMRLGGYTVTSDGTNTTISLGETPAVNDWIHVSYFIRENTGNINNDTINERILSSFIGDNTTTDFVVSGSVFTKADIYIEGILQYQTSEYSITDDGTDTTVSFTTAPLLNERIATFFMNQINTGQTNIDTINSLKFTNFIADGIASAFVINKVISDEKIFINGILVNPNNYNITDDGTDTTITFTGVPDNNDSILVNYLEVV